MHPGAAQQAQCGISGTVNAQGHLLPQLLQAPLQLGPPARKGVSGGQCQPTSPARGTARQERSERHRPWDLVPPSQVGTHLRFSSSLCADLPMPERGAVRGGAAVTVPGHWVAQNSLQISVPSKPFVRAWVHPGQQSKAHTPKIQDTCPGSCGVSPDSQARRFLDRCGTGSRNKSARGVSRGETFKRNCACKG